LVKVRREDKKEPHPYTQQELDRLLPALSEDTREIAHVFLDTGLRKGSLSDLQWDNVDFLAGMIHVKSKKIHYSVPMTRRVRDILYKRKMALDEQFQRTGLFSLQVYPTKDGEAGADILKRLKKAAVKVGVKGATVHRFRDTFATELISKDAPVEKVQKLMGHLHINMTLRYAQILPEELVDAIALLGR
jgi:integrase